MGLSTEQIASVCHEANRQLQRINGEIVNFPWESTSQDMRDSAVDGVENTLNGASPEENHENWMAFKRQQGWNWGPTKDFGKKLHPSMVPYDQLPESEKRKDALFHAIVHALAG